MPNPVNIFKDSCRNLKYNPDYKDYEIVYGHLTQKSENAKILRAAFIREVNEDYPHKIAFHQYKNRTHQGEYHGKKLFTLFTPTQIDNQEQYYDGLILFVDSSANLNEFIPLIRQAYIEQSFRHFSITVISNDTYLTENKLFEQALNMNIKPTYYIVELTDCEETLEAPKGFFVKEKADQELVTQIINEMSALTLGNNMPTLRDVTVSTVMGVLGSP